MPEYKSWCHGRTNAHMSIATTCGLLCTTCSPCSMHTSKSRKNLWHQCLLTYFLELFCNFWLYAAWWAFSMVFLSIINAHKYQIHPFHHHLIIMYQWKNDTGHTELQPTGGPQNLLWTLLRAAHVYTYINGGGGMNSPESHYLWKLSYTKSTVEWQGSMTH